MDAWINVPNTIYNMHLDIRLNLFHAGSKGSDFSMKTFDWTTFWIHT